MRRIVLFVTPDHLSKNPGSVTRFVVGSLLLSHGARRDVRLDLVLGGDGCMTFEGAVMRNVRPDEQSLSGILRAGLKRLREGGGGRIMQGIGTRPVSLDSVLGEGRGTRVYFTGGKGRSCDFGHDFVAFFQIPQLEEGVEEKLMKFGYVGMNLGKCQMSPDQAVVVLNNRADRDMDRK